MSNKLLNIAQRSVTLAARLESRAMPSTYVEAIPTLMVSRRVLRWVEESGIDTQAAFEAAYAFAKTVLPEAVARLDRFEPLVLLHCDSMLVVIFDRRSERFCIVAFFVDGAEPTPPDGPRPPSRRRPVIDSLISAFGLLDGVAATSASRPGWTAPASPRDVAAGMEASVALPASLRCTNDDLASREPRRLAGKILCASERDSTGSRSNYFPGAAIASESTLGPLDGRYRCLFWLNRSDGSFTDHCVD